MSCPAVDHAVIGRYTSHQSVEFVGGWKRAGGPDWVGKTTALGGHNVSTAVFETSYSLRASTTSTTRPARPPPSPATAAPDRRPARRSTSKAGSGES